MSEPPVLVSACLIGLATRYDARPLVEPDEVRALVRDGRAIPFCPEQAGGLPTPREPASIEPGRTGEDVLDGRARVVTASGRDVTAEFLRGAGEALKVVRRYGIRKAYLKSRSPSCGAGELRRLIGPLSCEAAITGREAKLDGGTDAGDGVTAALLRRAGVEVVALDAPRA